MLALLLASPGDVRAGEICAPDQIKRVRIGAQTFTVSVAASPRERERGLSGRDALAADSGMWFVLPTPDWHGFWMRDMNFPIDLIWISPARQVLGVITPHPCVTTEPCRIHTPPAPVAYVLEINADAFAGKTGDEATWSCTP